MNIIPQEHRRKQVTKGIERILTDGEMTHQEAANLIGTSYSSFQRRMNDGEFALLDVISIYKACKADETDWLYLIK